VWPEIRPRLNRHCAWLKSWASLWLLALCAGACNAAAVPEIPYANLPAEAQATLHLIKQSGSFPYARDGAVFGNREHLLPRHPRGYYTEYTVPTPGQQHRGARRIIAGAGSQHDPRSSGEYYYTDDHYRSFRRIRE